MPAKSRKRQIGAAFEQEDLIEAPARKSARQKQFEDGESTLEQARPYRIIIASMPISTLTPVWSLGQNRPVSERHVQKLCAIFLQGGLNRTAHGNYLQVLCSKEDVSKMMAHLNAEGDSGMSNAVDKIIDFTDWNSVTGNRKVEILAGQHRIRALEEYVKQTNSDNKELWWPCEFYDKGKRPTNYHQGENISLEREEATNIYVPAQTLCHTT